MPHVTVTRTIDAPVSEVWASWDDYANIDKFNPNLNRSFLIGENGATGLGATRQCDLEDGKNFIQERIVEYVPEQKVTVDIYNGTLPLKSAKAEVQMKPVGPNRTELNFTMHFVPKMGLLGLLMVPMMKPQFKKLLGKLVDGNRAYIESGVVIARQAA
ncbi:putative integral membrane protein [Roseibium album]|nr:putative integral membrane protein [Roseibium album]